MVIAMTTIVSSVMGDLCNTQVLVGLVFILEIQYVHTINLEVVLCQLPFYVLSSAHADNQEFLG
jgi:hypothetical protein